MKIRTGFVSNSSSTSFVIALTHRPRNTDDLRETLDLCFKEDIATKILTDIQQAEDLNDEELMEEFLSGAHHTDPPYEYVNGLDIEESKAKWKEWDERFDKSRAKLLESFKLSNPDAKHFVVLTYTDDYNTSVIEHSHYWRNNKCVVPLSHH